MTGAGALLCRRPLSNPRHPHKIPSSSCVVPSTPRGMTCPTHLAGLTHRPLASRSARRSVQKASRLRGATVTEGVCPYCAVGCGQLIYTKGGQAHRHRGQPREPHQRGHALPQGGRRLPARRQSAPRDPGPLPRPVLRSLGDAHRWTGRWTRSPAASRRRATRTSPIANESGRLLNSVRSIGTLGGATIDNEENYLIKKLFGGGLGVVSIENQARI